MQTLTGEAEKGFIYDKVLQMGKPGFESQLLEGKPQTMTQN